jgi:HEAT repeats/Domain of unknown function (DUF4304)
MVGMARDDTSDRHEGPRSAQDRFSVMMRDRVGPAMRELGFTGRTRNFYYQQGPMRASVELQKSRWNTKDEVDFTFNIGARNEDSGTTMGLGRPNHLVPDMDSPWWQVTTEASVTVTGDGVVRAMRDFVLPAILALFEDPDFSGDPDVSWRTWGRTFPFGPLRPTRDPFAHNQNPLVSEGRAWSDERVLEKLSDDNVVVRLLALQMIQERPSLRDARTSTLVKQCLEHDPHPGVRQNAARIVGIMPDEGVVDALQAAADEDEELKVRWSARYALALRPQM